MKTEYAILRDGTKIPVTSLEIAEFIFSDAICCKHTFLIWSINGVFNRRDRTPHMLDIINAADVVTTLTGEI